MFDLGRGNVQSVNAFLPASTGVVFAFGGGANGRLGLGSINDRCVCAISNIGIASSMGSFLQLCTSKFF